MSDAHTTIEDLKLRVRQFSQVRDWEQFHNPKDLALALVCEIGEVLEHFRYQTNDQIRDKLNSPPEHTALAHELADCLWLLLRIADVTGVDLASSLREKLVLADLKYPVDKVHGKPHKYTAYLTDQKE